MALSMDEQRVLAEIERRLSAEDPGLASCMTNFRRPGPAAVLRSPRARIIGSLFTVLLVAMISLMVYAMIPFRTHVPRSPSSHPDAPVGQTQVASSGTPAGTGTVTISSGGTRQTKAETKSAGSGAASHTAASGSTTPTTHAQASSDQVSSGKSVTSSHPAQAKAKSAGT